MPRPVRPAAERFWAKVDRTGECWLWTGYRERHGYGRFYPGPGQASMRAYVWAWEDAHGAVPKGLELDHLCRTPACVRPDHLEPVTHRENMLRGHGLASRAAAATHCPQGHAYDETNTYLTPSTGHRTCRTCRKAQMDALNVRRREANAAAGRARVFRNR